MFTQVNYQDPTFFEEENALMIQVRLLEKNETRSRSSTEENIKADDIDDILPPPPTLLRQTSYEKSKQIKKRVVT